MTFLTPNIDLLDLSGVITRPKDRYAVAAQQILRRGLQSLWTDSAGSSPVTAEQRANASISVMADEKPVPTMGYCFFAIQGIERIEASDSYESCHCSVVVHITTRTSAIAWERVGITKAVRSRFSSNEPRLVISFLAQAVSQLLHESQALIDISNAEYPEEPILQNRLHIESYGEPREVGPEHFTAVTSSNRPEVGLVQTVRFTNGFWHRNTTPCSE